MDFGTALKQMTKNGAQVTRSAWDDQKRLVSLVTEAGDTHFIRNEKMHVGHWNRVDLPYNPTVSDILAVDWEFPR